MDLKQSLTELWKEVLHVNRPRRFEEIVGHDDIKQIFVKAILSKRPVHLLLVASPGSAKTMFLTEIMRHHKTSYFVVGSNRKNECYRPDMSVTLDGNRDNF